MSSSVSTYLLALVVVALAVLLAARLSGRMAHTLRMRGIFRHRVRTSPVDVTRAAAYHMHLPAERRAESLDDRTWSDLDLDAVFTSLDRTVSKPGRQVLYHMLRTPGADESVRLRLERTIAALDDDGVAERAAAALAELEDPRAGRMVELLFGELPNRPRGWMIFPALTVASLVLLSLAIARIWPTAAVVWLLVCVANVLLQLAFRPRVKRLVPAMHQMPRFIRAAALLARIPAGALEGELTILRDGARKLGALRRATWWLQFEPGQTNELAASLYEYVNLALLLDVNAFVLAISTVREQRELIREMFDVIGFLDAALSVRAWRQALPRWTSPQFTAAQKSLEIEGLVHPLVADPVANSIALGEKSALITGSNMAGKSTFVRAIGLGAILGQALDTVCADRWVGTPLRVRTSIGRSDSVLDGKSYYLAEAESVLELVRASEDATPHLFLLDEIFRGTNTTERIAAGAAVLSYLDRGPHLVVVATHDLELLDLLRDAYTAHHFREHVADGALRFDYRLYDGPSSTRNAIALLQLLDYPADLVADAIAATGIAGAMSTGGQQI